MENFTDYLVFITPAITAVVTVITAVVKLLKTYKERFEGLGKKIEEVKENTKKEKEQNEKLVGEIAQVLHENAVLKKRIDYLLEQLTGIREG